MKFGLFAKFVVTVVCSSLLFQALSLVFSTPYIGPDEIMIFSFVMVWADHEERKMRSGNQLNGDSND